MDSTRRQFLRTAAGGLAAMGSAPLAGMADTPGKGQAVTARSLLAKKIYARKEVDDWLNGRRFNFAKYDSRFGWLLKNARFAEGIDGSTCFYHYVDNGDHERVMIAHADKPCRINTYGNSFTMCHQVNDGETWQEVLASHLGEPVRNFGVGAWSVYQAFLRMKHEERRVPADVVILNIYDDDHYRNLDAWRHIRAGKDFRFLCPTCPHLVVNLGAGTCEERPNPCPTRESVYNLCDLDWVEARFRDDFVLGIMLAHANAREKNPDRAYQAIMNLARTHGINTDLDRSQTASTAAHLIHTRAALAATRRIVEWTEGWAKANGKKVIYVLSFNALNIVRRVREGERFDKDFVAFLQEKNLPFVDLMQAHLDDFARFSIDIEEYVRRYYIGHYNPLGNVFTAHAIKDKLVEMLDPKPTSYQKP